MFFNVLSHFQDNRKKIIIIIVVVALIIFFIKELNEYVAKNRASKINSSSNTTAISQTSSNDTLVIKNTVADNTSSNQIQFEESSINSVEKVLSVFLFYCNNEQISDAYSLLTDDCKNVLYPTQDDFYNNYFNKYFKNVKNCSYSQYGGNSSNVYKITFQGDPITTGSKTDQSLIDYITIIDENNTYKISVSGFVSTEELDINKTNDYLEANVTNKTTYVDYEIYTIKIKNTTLANMLLGDITNNESIYLLDEDDNKFYIKNNEYTEENVTINYKSENTIELKFDKKIQTTNSETKKIVFSEVNLINREYYDNTTIEENVNGNVTYKKRFTTYKNNFNFEIEL